MGIILWLLAKLLSNLLQVPALFHTIAGAFRFKGGWNYVNRAFLNAAYAEDVYGNIAYATMLNDLFIKKGGYHYGARNETISSATGKNWVNDKLAFLGKGLAGTLNLIDYPNWKNGGHCWVSIQGWTQYDFIGKRPPKRVPIYYTASFILIAFILLYALWKLAIWLIILSYTLLF
jgi:hypothetical protein